jgi:hypothetical protein
MRLHERYRPEYLKDILGQNTAALREFVAAPYPTCWAIEGPTGTGKTTAASAMARELGAYDDALFDGPFHLNGADLSVEMAKAYFGAESPFRLRRRGWHVLIIEELEWVSPQCQRYLKDALERVCHRHRLVVIATSNNLAKMERALRHRFEVVYFDNGPEFVRACLDRLAVIWDELTKGLPMPPVAWGIDEREGNGFSMRLALDQLARAYTAAKRATKRPDPPTAPAPVPTRKDPPTLDGVAARFREKLRQRAALATV